MKVNSLVALEQVPTRAWVVENETIILSKGQISDPVQTLVEKNYTNDSTLLPYS
jgi:hypothetical protein